MKALFTYHFYQIIRKFIYILLSIEVSIIITFRVDYNPYNTYTEVSKIIECITLGLILFDLILIIVNKRLKLICYLFMALTFTFLSVYFILRLITRSEIQTKVMLIMKLLCLSSLFILFNEHFIYLFEVKKRQIQVLNAINSNKDLDNKGNTILKVNSKNILENNYTYVKNKNSHLTVNFKKVEPDRLSVDNNMNHIYFNIDKTIEDLFKEGEIFKNSAFSRNLNPNILSIKNMYSEERRVLEAPEISKESDDYIQSDMSRREENHSLRYYLSNIQSENFNIFDLSTASLNNPLYVSLSYIFYFYTIGDYGYDKKIFLNLAYNIQQK